MHIYIIINIVLIGLLIIIIIKKSYINFAKNVLICAAN